MPLIKVRSASPSIFCLFFFLIDDGRMRIRYKNGTGSNEVDTILGYLRWSRVRFWKPWREEQFFKGGNTWRVHLSGARGHVVRKMNVSKMIIFTSHGILLARNLYLSLSEHMWEEPPVLVGRITNSEQIGFLVLVSSSSRRFSELLRLPRLWRVKFQRFK